MFGIIFFDALIFGGIYLSFLGIRFFWKKYSLSRSPQHLHRLLIVLFAIPGLVLIYGSFIEPSLIVVRDFDYSFDESKSLSTPKRIVLISDTHVGPYKKQAFAKRVVEKIRSLEPDLILLAGDYFLSDYAHEAQEGFMPYGDLPHIAPTVAVMGNHGYRVGMPGKDIPDYEEAHDVRELLQELGILGLEDAVATFFDDDPIHIIGAQDIWSGVDNFSGIDLPDRSERTIVVSHNPDLILKAQDKVDMVVSGHTHGGQIRLPIIGPLGTPGNTPLPRSTFKGPSFWGDTLLYVTSGLGESGPRARLFNPPEIVLMTLR